MFSYISFSSPVSCYSFISLALSCFSDRESLFNFFISPCFFSRFFVFLSFYQFLSILLPFQSLGILFHVFHLSLCFFLITCNSQTFPSPFAYLSSHLFLLSPPLSIIKTLSLSLIILSSILLPFLSLFASSPFLYFHLKISITFGILYQNTINHPFQYFIIIISITPILHPSLYITFLFSLSSRPISLYHPFYRLELKTVLSSFSHSSHPSLSFSSVLLSILLGSLVSPLS
ncbi:unnamed protein product [Acanthosepion pharaonis]|uniref:Uncharacterized protein n=1 Tax=Acanthosepion pharaonis TaxID=158019 RepID=A0A812CCX0_ACAPH|nr:unnamed protein product [Sepia pharaonis]